MTTRVGKQSVMDLWPIESGAFTGTPRRRRTAMPECGAGNPSPEATMISSPSRRQFLGMGATGLVLATGLRPASAAVTTATTAAPPFTLGVASGDPTHD